MSLDERNEFDTSWELPSQSDQRLTHLRKELGIHDVGLNDYICGGFQVKNLCLQDIFIRPSNHLS